MASPTPAERAFAWLPVLLWSGAILLLGSDSYSQAGTSRYLGPFLRWLFAEAGPGPLEEIHFVIRKAAHFIEYGVLAGFAIRAFRLGGLRRPAPLAIRSLVLVLCIAAFDEGRQAVSAERGGSAADVLLDAAGGLVVCAAYAIFARARTRG